MAAGFPPRSSPLCPAPPELAIRTLADIDEVLEVVIVAHVVYQGFAVVKRPHVQSLFEVIIQASAAVVTNFMVLDNPVSARSAYSVPQLLHPPVPHHPASPFTRSAHERLIAVMRAIGMCVHVIDWVIVR
jgi:hypothetical protein